MSSPKLVDATKPIVGIISASDRADAIRCSPSHCPGANCFKRARGVIDARVGNGSARLLRRDGWHRYQLDKSTIAAVKAYDTAGEVIPEGFRFVLIPPRVKLGQRAGEMPGSNRRSGARQSVATRTPSARSLFVEPPSKP